MSPAVEKMRSDGTDVAGIAKSKTIDSKFKIGDNYQYLFFYRLIAIDRNLSRYIDKSTYRSTPNDECRDIMTGTFGYECPL